jgi:periplasmic copper chaperone A
VKTLTRLVVVLSLALVLPACGEDTDEAVVLDDQVTAAEPDDAAAEDAAADDAADDATDDPADDVAGAVDAVAVSDVRSRMSPRMAGVAAVYLDIENRSDVDDRLVAASVAPEVAGIVEIHETFEVDDVGMDGDGMDGDGMGGDGEGSMAEGMAMMGMREIDAIDLPAGSTVELAPGGLHIMLLDLVADLSPGDAFALTLEFAEAGTLTTTVEVREDV